MAEPEKPASGVSPERLVANRVEQLKQTALLEAILQELQKITQKLSE